MEIDRGAIYLNLVVACHAGPCKQENIIVGGYSQGGAVALATALRSPHKLGACLGQGTP
jgi:predicted esterase